MTAEKTCGSQYGSYHFGIVHFYLNIFPDSHRFQKFVTENIHRDNFRFHFYTSGRFFKIGNFTEGTFYQT
ncbi:MAG TPA: hypothetical protein DCQ37_17100 [Desulfobacteraceae bacterium]|nr:hypothetical protein [Desulfobacteraceae bacterium]